MVNLNNQVALVTGGSKGIGKAISLALAKAGASVVLVSRNAEQLNEVHKKIQEQNGFSQVIPTDLCREEEINRLFDQIEKKYNRLDILINNAGAATYGQFADFPLKEYDYIMQVNVRAMYCCCQKALKLMIPARRGYIINIASVVGFKGYPNQSAYTISKHGVIGLTKSLSAEVQKDNIRVSVIMPGGVDTDLVRKARPDLDTSVLMQPENIAQTVLYLLSLWGSNAMVDQIYIRRKNSTPFK